MRTPYLYLLILVVLISSSCMPAAPTTAPAPTESADTPTAVPVAPTEIFRSLNRIEIEAPSLVGNLVGEPTKRTIYVYLPPSYSSTEKRYPVIYYLPGYGDSSILGFQLPTEMDSLIDSGHVQEMIIVVASGDSKMGGSFYVNAGHSENIVQ